MCRRHPIQNSTTQKHVIIHTIGQANIEVPQSRQLLDIIRRRGERLHNVLHLRRTLCRRGQILLPFVGDLLRGGAQLVLRLIRQHLQLLRGSLQNDTGLLRVLIISFLRNALKLHRLFPESIQRLLPRLLRLLRPRMDITLLLHFDLPVFLHSSPIQITNSYTLPL